MRNIPLQIKKMLREVSEELNEPYELVEEIYYHQFEFLRDSLEEGKDADYPTFQNVLLKHLGTFYASERKLKFFRDNGISKGKKLGTDPVGSDSDDDIYIA